MTKKSTYEFIEKARKIHNDKYDCSKVIYEAERIPIIIIYPVNGEYKQIHLYHLQGYDCPINKFLHRRNVTKTNLTYV